MTEKIGQYYFDIKGGNLVNTGKIIELDTRGSEKFSWKVVLQDLGVVAVGVLTVSPFTVLAASVLTHGIDYASNSWRLPAAAMIVAVGTLGSMIGSLEISKRFIKPKPKLAGS